MTSTQTIRSAAPSLTGLPPSAPPPCPSEPEIASLTDCRCRRRHRGTSHAPPASAVWTSPAAKAGLWSSSGREEAAKF